MRDKNKLILLLIFINLINITKSSVIDFNEKFEKIKSESSNDIQEISAFNVISRLIPTKANLFNVKIDSSLSVNSFKLLNNNKTNGIVQIIGSSGTAICRGFHYYLKYYLNSHISWEGNQLKNIPTIITIC